MLGIGGYAMAKAKNDQGDYSIERTTPIPLFLENPDEAKRLGMLPLEPPHRMAKGDRRR